MSSQNHWMDIAFALQRVGPSFDNATVKTIGIQKWKGHIQELMNDSQSTDLNGYA